MPSIDVVIPSYNYGHCLSDSIDSVLTQGIENLRILVIDNASTDNSVEIARGFAAKDPRIQVRAHEKNLGPHASFNEGVDWARGDYLLFLCADDLITLGCLTRALRVLEGNSEIVLVYGRELVWDGIASLPDFSKTCSDESKYQLIDCKHIIESCSLPREPPATGSALVRTSAQKQAGYFRAEVYYNDDFEMLMRLACLGPLAEIDAIQGIRRHHGENVSADYWGNWRRELEAMLTAYESFFANEGMTFPAAQSLRSKVRRNIAHRAYWSGVSHRLRGFPKEANELFEFAGTLEPMTSYVPPLAYWFRVENAMQIFAHKLVELTASRLSGKGSPDEPSSAGR
jgi:glycosyltransferase involved in cell wall biosynthesis